MAYNIYRYVTLALWGAVIGATGYHVCMFFKDRAAKEPNNER